MLIIKNEKSETAKGKELLNQKSIRMLEEKKNFKFFRILAAESI